MEKRKHFSQLASLYSFNFLPALLILYLFNNNYSKKCGVISQFDYRSCFISDNFSSPINSSENKDNLNWLLQCNCTKFFCHYMLTTFCQVLIGQTYWWRVSNNIKKSKKKSQDLNLTLLFPVKPLNFPQLKFNIFQKIYIRNYI